MFFCTKHSLPVGTVTLASDGERLCGLWLAGQKYYGQSIPGEMQERKALPVFDAAKNWLHRYFAGKRPAASELPLLPIGSPFRQAVWQLLCEIPYGQTITYGEIARQMNRPLAGQAVGGAVGHNPISIIIPCHRVVGANGSLTGYAGGLEVKTRLLKLEGVDISKLTAAGAKNRQ